MKRKPSLFQARPATKRTNSPLPETLQIESLSHEGRGIAKHSGKTIFISGALPGETVKFKLLKQHRRFDEAECTEVVNPAPSRVEPACPHYSQCGGCDLQHLSSAEQLINKQKLVLEQLQRLGGLTPLNIEPPIAGPHWHYRRSCRIGINQRQKDGSALVGFRRRGSNKLTSVDHCSVVQPAINALLEQLPAILESTDQFKQITHAEVILGDQDGAILLRIKKALPQSLLDALTSLTEAHQLGLYLEPDQGPVQRIGTFEPRLNYTLPDYNLTLHFEPGDFIQVNAEINRAMINRAMEWLNIKPGERVLDLFAGIGNFTLPLATQAGQVVAVEGVEKMVERARNNAALNGLDNCEFYRADLSSDLRAQPWFKQGFDKILLDPPRTGAAELLTQISQYNASAILYVSCNPAALARDGELLARQGYKLTRYCVMDMFPQTSHIESLALFEAS